MVLLCAGTVAGGCGSSSAANHTDGGATGGAAGLGDAGDAGLAGDGTSHAPDVLRAADGPGSICDGGKCVDVAGNLSGLLWELPCTSKGNTCSTVAAQTVSTVLGGTAGVTYDVQLHFEGIVEQKTYTGGCSDGAYFLTGGASNGDSFNVYELTVSSPPAVYFLNRGTSGINNCYVIDYIKTIRVDAGATLTLLADAVDGAEISNVDPKGAPLMVPGASVAQPYDGQFIQMDVLSVVPDPVASAGGGAGGAAGYAMQFDGTQAVTVADAPSLEPAALTLETWFQFSGTGNYDVMIGKPYQTGTGDSYALWYQGGLYGGTSLDSTGGAASSTWTPVLGEWHHAALTYENAATAGVITMAGAQQQILYIDGLPVSCAPSSAAVTAYDRQPLLIGSDYAGGALDGEWRGALDEVRVFSTVRTADQIWADMHTHVLGPTPGLVGEWTFDEGAGQTSADSSGAGNTAVLGATTAVETSDPVWVPSTVPR